MTLKKNETKKELKRTVQDKMIIITERQRRGKKKKKKKKTLILKLVQLV